MKETRGPAGEAGAGGPSTLALQSFAPFRIVALGDAVGRALREAYREEGVTIAEWRVLAVIAQDDGGAAARDVARMTPMDKMSVSRAIAGLERKGFVARLASAADKRVAQLSLTQDGLDLYRRIAKKALGFEEKWLAALDGAERQAFAGMLAKLERRAASLGDE